MPEHDWGAVLLINKYHELEAVPYLSLMNGIRSILDGKAPNLAAMNHATQWSLSGIVILFAASAVLGLIRFARKTGINRQRRLSLAIIAIVSALALIPLFSYCIGVPWRSIALFAPDIALLIRSLAAIFAFYGIASILLIVWKGMSSS